MLILLNKKKESVKQMDMDIVVSVLMTIVMGFFAVVTLKMSDEKNDNL